MFTYQRSYGKVMFSLSCVCPQWEPMWTLPMMHWTSLHSMSPKPCTPLGIWDPTRQGHGTGALSFLCTHFCLDYSGGKIIYSQATILHLEFPKLVTHNRVVRCRSLPLRRNKKIIGQLIMSRDSSQKVYQNYRSVYCFEYLRGIMVNCWVVLQICTRQP